ncbi:MAG: hypothetical protein QNJ54_36755 [Prochloraceae cyanobacterium]|nr:hypothetical protein [Prochloraceae cyanobacterium]
MQEYEDIERISKRLFNLGSHYEFRIEPLDDRIVLEFSEPGLVLCKNSQIEINGKTYLVEEAHKRINKRAKTPLRAVTKHLRCGSGEWGVGSGEEY